MKNKELVRLQNKKYRETYPWRCTYNDIDKRCNNSKCLRYKDYGGRGIKCLISKEELKELWFRDKAYLMKKPSIDRINNDGNYEISNCRYIELVENSRRASFKPILQYDLDGNFIKEWNSLTMACSNLNIKIASISNNLTNHSKSCGGYIWKYKED